MISDFCRSEIEKDDTARISETNTQMYAQLPTEVVNDHNILKTPDGSGVSTKPQDVANEAANQGAAFTPGGIHVKEVRSFWETELKANAWVLDTLEHGYVLPFHTAPDSVELRNNLSARKHQDFVRQEVEKLQLQGVVQWVDEKPWVVSPLTVAINAKGKKRLCLDLSRTVNPCISQNSVVLADLNQALHITESGDWQAVYDLTSAYHHIKIFEPHIKFLGAACTKQDGSKQYFVYHFLPFGMSSAVQVMTKIMKPLSAYIAKQSIRHTIYLDDGRVVAGSEQLARLHYAQVLSILDRGDGK